MGKNKTKRLIHIKSPGVTDKNAAPIQNTESLQEKLRRKPVLGMTWMHICDGRYALEALNRNKSRYKELAHMQSILQNCESIDRFLDYFAPKNGEIDWESKPALKAERERLSKLAGLENKTPAKGGFRHIHCKGGNWGKFTLFGFQYENVFEILLLDPEHEIADGE